jgi:hypothetical protein
MQLTDAQGATIIAWVDHTSKFELSSWFGSRAKRAKFCSAVDLALEVTEAGTTVPTTSTLNARFGDRRCGA